jgi:hypothetical protein
MDKPTRTSALVYGYAVCLVAVITFLICVSTLISSISDLGDPIHAGFNMPGVPSLASYDNYKMDILKNGQSDGSSKPVAFTPDETSMKAMYEAAKNDKIQKVNFDSRKSILISSIMILLALTLFITHWKWMQSRAKIQ